MRIYSGVSVQGSYTILFKHYTEITQEKSNKYRNKKKTFMNFISISFFHRNTNYTKFILPFIIRFLSFPIKKKCPY